MSIKTGFSKICINPSMGIPIVGYYNKRLTKGILDDIYVRAVAFEIDGKKAVLVTADLCIFSEEQCNKYRKNISEFCGINEDAIFISCSHTHTGPLTKKDFASELDCPDYYKEFVEVSIRDVAFYALEDLAPSKIYSAQSEAKNISFVRRFKMLDGSVRTNPGAGNKEIDHALGEPNETVKLLKIVRQGADDIFIVNFGTHPDTVGGDYISADWPGFVCKTVEDALPGTKCMFLLAPQGDVNHVNPNPTEADSVGLTNDFDDVPRGYEHAKYMGRVIAGAVLSVCDKALELKTDDIIFAKKGITIPSHQENDKLPEARKIVELYESGRASELPYKGMALTTAVAGARRIVRLENGPEFFSFKLFAIKIGELVFLGIPGEPFTEIANRIYDASNFKTTILCCLTNGGGSYFPTSKAYLEGGYETSTSNLSPGGDDIIVNGVIDLLDEIK